MDAMTSLTVNENHMVYGGTIHRMTLTVA